MSTSLQRASLAGRNISQPLTQCGGAGTAPFQQAHVVCVENQPGHGYYPSRSPSGTNRPRPKWHWGPRANGRGSRRWRNTIRSIRRRERGRSSFRFSCHRFLDGPSEKSCVPFGIATRPNAARCREDAAELIFQQRIADYLPRAHVSSAGVVRHHGQRTLRRRSPALVLLEHALRINHLYLQALAYDFGVP
jgi:hypothetical protein